MEATFMEYDVECAMDRLRDLLDGSFSYEEKKEIPPRGRLTYTNGFYVFGTSIFVDIRESTKLANDLKRPTLARVYRAFISEIIAILQGDESTREIFVEGDCVWAMLSTPKKKDIDRAFGTACACNSLMQILSHSLEKKSMTPIRAGIGIAYGRALMIKAGFNGSGTNDVVWLGKVVARAAELCNLGNKESFLWGYEDPIFIDSSIYKNLSKNNTELCALYSDDGRTYTSSAVRTDLSDWFQSREQAGSGL